MTCVSDCIATLLPHVPLSSINTSPAHPVPTPPLARTIIPRPAPVDVHVSAKPDAKADPDTRTSTSVTGLPTGTILSMAIAEVTMTKAVTRSEKPVSTTMFLRTPFSSDKRCTMKTPVSATSIESFFGMSTGDYAAGVYVGLAGNKISKS